MEQVKISSSDERNRGYGPAYVIQGDMPDYIVGRLCTLIESWGLPEKQEKAAKDIIRQEAYSWIAKESESLYIPGQLNNVIREALKEADRIDSVRPLRAVPETMAQYAYEDWSFELIATVQED